MSAKALKEREEYWNKFVNKLKDKYETRSKLNPSFKSVHKWNFNPKGDLVDELLESTQKTPSKGEVDKLDLLDELIDKYQDMEPVEFSQEDFNFLAGLIVNYLHSPICDYIFLRDEARFLEDQESFDNWHSTTKSEVNDLKKIIPKPIVKAFVQRISLILYAKRDEEVEVEVENKLKSVLIARQKNLADEALKKKVKRQYERLGKKYDKRIVLWYGLRVLLKIVKDSS